MGMTTNLSEDCTSQSDLTASLRGMKALISSLQDGWMDSSIRQQQEYLAAIGGLSSRVWLLGGAEITDPTHEPKVGRQGAAYYL